MGGRTSLWETLGSKSERNQGILNNGENFSLNLAPNPFPCELRNIRCQLILTMLGNEEASVCLVAATCPPLVRTAFTRVLNPSGCRCGTGEGVGLEQGPPRSPCLSGLVPSLLIRSSRLRHWQSSKCVQSCCCPGPSSLAP